MPQPLNPDAYVIADYLLSAMLRLRVHGPALREAVYRTLADYPHESTGPAIAFLNAMTFEPIPGLEPVRRPTDGQGSFSDEKHRGYQARRGPHREDEDP